MGDVASIKRKKRSSQSAQVRDLAKTSEVRALAAALITRSQLAAVRGTTYDGRRDMYTALGYPRKILPEHYRFEYERNAVAARIVEAKPQSTWRGGGEVIEDESPDVDTEFEQAWTELNERLSCWSIFQRADILAGLGRYAIILLGAPGILDQPLIRLTGPEQLVFLAPYSEQDAQVAIYEESMLSPRFGRPIYYSVSRMAPYLTVPGSGTSMLTQSGNSPGGRRVHYTRIMHIADGLLDDPINAPPRLERCWNLLINLEKVTGGGAEAFWRRADAGMQIDVDPEMELTPDEEAALDEEVDRYLHKLDRIIRTRGVKMNPLTSAVAGFKDPTDAIMSQLSAGTGIPQRILMGSERGQLASTQDDDNWTQRIVDRRRDFATPGVVRPFIDRLIGLNALPKPKSASYKVGWPELDNLDEVQKASVAAIWAAINKDMGQEVVTPNEIRDRLLGLPPKEMAAVITAATGNKARFMRKFACLTAAQRHEYITEFVAKETQKRQEEKVA